VNYTKVYDVNTDAEEFVRIEEGDIAGTVSIMVADGEDIAEVQVPAVVLAEAVRRHMAPARVEVEELTGFVVTDGVEQEVDVDVYPEGDDYYDVYDDEDEEPTWVITPDDLRHLASLAESAQFATDLSAELEVGEIEVAVGDDGFTVTIAQDTDDVYGLVIL
jgi:hypothetical protein